MTQVRRLRGVNRVGGVVGRFGPNGESGVWPVHSRASDPYYDDVSLLLHMNGTDGSTTFTDSSRHGHTVTAYGNAQVDDGQSKFGGASALFDGTGDYLQAPDNAAFEIGGGDFTIEAWIYLTGYSVNWEGAFRAAICAKDVNGSGRTFNWTIRGTSSSWTSMGIEIYSAQNSFTDTTGSFTFSLNTWYHVAVRRANGIVRHYVDGVDVGGGTNTRTAQNSNVPFSVGTIDYVQAGALQGGFQFFFIGNIDELRFTKGRARYQSTFTPPARPFLP